MTVTVDGNTLTCAQGKFRHILKKIWRAKVQNNRLKTVSRKPTTRLRMTHFKLPRQAFTRDSLKLPMLARALSSPLFMITSYTSQTQATARASYSRSRLTDHSVMSTSARHSPRIRSMSKSDWRKPSQKKLTFSCASKTIQRRVMWRAVSCHLVQLVISDLSIASSTSTLSSKTWAFADRFLTSLDHTSHMNQISKSSTSPKTTSGSSLQQTDCGIQCQGKKLRN